jgi:NitT/TauT family transport system substrate-binding protein
MRVGKALASVAVLAVAVSLAGCAGHSTGSKASTSGGLINLTVADTSPGAGYSDLQVGIQEGIFAKHGLKVTLKHLPDSTQLVPSLLSGSVQIGVGPASSTAAAILKGEPLTFIGMSEAHYNLEMWASPSVTSVAGLKGKKVAITAPGSEADFGLTALLAQAGMTRDDVTTAYVKSVPGEISALQSNAVSAILTQPPNGTQTRAHGYHRLVALSNLPFALGAYTAVNKFLASNKDAVTKFMAAEAENLAYLHNNKDGAISIIEKYSGNPDPDLAAYSWEFFNTVWSTDPSVPTDVIQDAFKQAADKAKTTPPADVTKYIDNSYTAPLKTDGTLTKLYPNGTAAPTPASPAASASS